VGRPDGSSGIADNTAHTVARELASLFPIAGTAHIPDWSGQAEKRIPLVFAEAEPAVEVGLPRVGAPDLWMEVAPGAVRAGRMCLVRRPLPRSRPVSPTTLSNRLCACVLETYRDYSVEVSS